MRAHDAGEIGIGLAAGIGSGVLILIAVLVGAGAGTGQNTSTCQPQPAPASTATNGIPATYLALYRRAGQATGIPWDVLAGIGEVETDHGRSNAPGVHTGANIAGAEGPMQFLPATWAQYGNGGNIYNPTDAIPAAARYLKASGAPQHLTQAIFAYNHSSQYVNTVLNWATRYAGQPPDTLTAADPACTQPTTPQDPGPPPTAVAAQIIRYALAQLGKPYIWGGTGPDGYDCSGLTLMAYRSAGITIPRLANYQYFNEPHIPPGTEQPGDLAFFAGSDGTPTDPGHVGIIYNTQQETMIVAPHTGTNIQIQSFRNYPGGVVGFTRPSLGFKHE